MPHPPRSAAQMSTLAEIVGRFFNGPKVPTDIDARIYVLAERAVRQQIVEQIREFCASNQQVRMSDVMRIIKGD